MREIYWQTVYTCVFAYEYEYVIVISYWYNPSEVIYALLKLLYSYNKNTKIHSYIYSGKVYKWVDVFPEEDHVYGKEVRITIRVFTSRQDYPTKNFCVTLP